MTLYDDIAKIRRERVPDWEREVLIRQWVRDRDDDVRWLIKRLDTQRELADETLWSLVEDLWAQLGRLRRTGAELAAENARLRSRP